MLGNGLVPGMYNPATVWCSDTSLLFDGINDHCSFELEQDATTARLPDELVVSFWAQHNGNVMIGNEDTFFQLRVGSGRPDLSMRVFWDESTEAIIVERDNADSSSQFYMSASHSATDFKTLDTHFAIVVNGEADLAAIYINGVKESDVTSIGGRWNYGGSEPIFLNLGACDVEIGHANYFTGWLHDICVYGAAINPSRITDAYNNGYPKNQQFDQDLFLYHTCGEKNFLNGTQISTFCVNNSAQELDIIEAKLVSHGSQD
jgi:hypothetical protein